MRFLVVGYQRFPRWWWWWCYPTLPGGPGSPFLLELVSKGQIPSMNFKDLFSDWQSSIKGSELQRMTLTLPFGAMNVTTSEGAMLFGHECLKPDEFGPVPFRDIEAGVLCMAKFVTNPSTPAFGSAIRTFWSSLLDPNRVRHIFSEREGLRKLLEPFITMFRP